MSAKDQKYPKDSMERFGDDLTELVLSYLRFKDKFRFECLSKQIQRLVFNKVFDYKLDFNTSNSMVELRQLSTVLMKCPKITTISLYKYIKNKPKVFELIHKLCLHLSAIETDFNLMDEKTIDAFCGLFGPKLRGIRFNSDFKSNVMVLKCCPNLTQLSVLWFSDLSPVFTENQLLFKKLTTFSFTYSSSDISRIQEFCEDNRNTLEAIEFAIREPVNEYEFKMLFNSLKLLSKLKTIDFNCKPMVSKSFANCLRLMAENCKKLKKIKLNIETDDQFFGLEIYKTFNCFKSLEILYFDFFLFGYEPKPTEDRIVFTSEALKDCKRLTHFHNYSNEIQITDQFFASINDFLPELQVIRCHNSDITDQTFHSLAGLSKLRKIDLFSDSSRTPITESVVQQLVKRLPRIQSIICINRYITVDLNEETISALKTTGHPDSHYPTVRHTYSLKGSDSDSDCDSDNFYGY